MLFTDVIRKKRDGAALNDAEIAYFVAGLADGSIPAEQVSALAMAIFLNSMSSEETARLTTGMAASGTMLDWHAEGIDGPVVDKHSTGGVGDKVSFLLAPIVAACGGYVPMISGRGLGHTGGTTDKIESIPGYNALPEFAAFRRVVQDAGCAIIGQTSELAPADGRFYAIRDVTATVESVPLITASILSKKLAAGLDALVMDVKVGSGAFMSSMDNATQLAESIIATAAAAGLKTHALITDMNECLGDTAGNALEIAEAMEFLANEHREKRLDEVVLALCAEMLLMTSLASNQEDARERVERAIISGDALAVFGKMVDGLGGPADFVERYRDYLPAAPVSVPVHARRKGFVVGMDAFAVGNAIIELGGGRRKLAETLDLSVGLSGIAHIGDCVDAERPLATIHGASEAAVARASEMLQNACCIGDEAPPPRPVVYRTLGG